MMRSVIGTPRSARISIASSSSQSTGRPVNFWTSDLRKFMELKVRQDLILSALLGRLWRRFAQGPAQIALHPVEDAIDETSRIGPAKRFRELDRFIDRNDRRDVFAIKHFINRQSKHVPVDRRDAVEIVVRTIFSDPVINLGQVCDHPVDERLRELPHPRGGGEELPKFVHLFRGIAAMQVAPEM